MTATQSILEIEDVNKIGTAPHGDLDELLALGWQDPAFLPAHPRTAAAFGREIPDEYQPSPSVRFMGIDDNAIISYLTTQERAPAAFGRECNGRHSRDSKGVIGPHQTGLGR